MASSIRKLDGTIFCDRYYDTVFVGVPTYAYPYETAVEVDRVLVPYHNIETTMKFLEQGITYDDLSAADKARYEEDFTDEDGDMPDFIPSPAVNEFRLRFLSLQPPVDLLVEGRKNSLR